LKGRTVLKLFTQSIRGNTGLRIVKSNTLAAPMMKKKMTVKASTRDINEDCLERTNTFSKEMAVFD
jgi:hypothetical protein